MTHKKSFVLLSIKGVDITRIFWEWNGETRTHTDGTFSFLMSVSDRFNNIRGNRQQALAGHSDICHSVGNFLN
jgi:hypothetical protein